MNLLAEAAIGSDPATILGQWVGIAVGVVTLLAVAVGMGINLQRLKNLGTELNSLRKDFSDHETRDELRFSNVDIKIEVVDHKVDGLKLQLAGQGMKFSQQ